MFGRSCVQELPVPALDYLLLRKYGYLLTTVPIIVLTLSVVSCVGSVASAQSTLIERQVVDPALLASALPDSLRGGLARRRAIIEADGNVEGGHAISRASVRTDSYPDGGAFVNAWVKTHAEGPQSLQDALALYQSEEISEEFVQGFRTLISRGDRSGGSTMWTARVHLSDMIGVLVRTGSRLAVHEILNMVDMEEIAALEADLAVFIDPELRRMFANVGAHDVYLEAIAPRVIHVVPAVKLEALLPQAPSGYNRSWDSPPHHSITTSIDGELARAATRAGFGYWDDAIGREKRVRLVVEDVDAEPGRNQEVLELARQGGYPITSVREYPAFLRVEPPTNSFTQPDSFLVVLVGDRRRIAISRPNTSLAAALLDSLDIERLASLSPRIQAIHGNPEWQGNEMTDISWERVIGPWRPDSTSLPDRIRVELGWWRADQPLRDPLEFELPEGSYVDNLLEAECNATQARALVLMSSTPAVLCRWNGRIYDLVRVQPIIALDEVEFGQHVPTEWLERWDGYALSKFPRWTYRYDISFAEVGERLLEQLGRNTVVWMDAQDVPNGMYARVGFIKIDGATYMGTALATEGHIESTFRALRDVLASLTTVQ